MGLLEPHGRHRGGDGGPALTPDAGVPDPRRSRRRPRQARAGPRRPQRADGGRQGDRRHPAARDAADRDRARRQGRDRPAARPFRPSQGPAPAGHVAGAGDPALFGRCSAGRSGSSTIAAARARHRRSRRSRPATSPSSRIPASTTARRTNDPALAAAIAALGDLYVNDAFSAAHRAHASTEGVAHLLPAYAGRAMQAELEALEKALGNPERPVAAVVGGAKVSTKLDVLEPPGRQGRPSDHRRRHGQHLPRRARRRGRQVPGRARSRRHRARDPRRRRAGGLHRPSAL